MAKTGRIKNKQYLLFLEQGQINTLDEKDIRKALNQCNGLNGKWVEEARCLILMMYYSGARPNEVLNLRESDIDLKKPYLVVKMKGSKRGLPRVMHFSYRLKLVKMLWEYVSKCPPGYYLFFHFRNRYVRRYKTKKGEQRVIIQTTDKLRYHFKKWFKGIPEEEGVPPYFLRHNRFSLLSEAGATPEEMRQFKGSKTFTSITPYLHMSSRMARNIAKRIK